MTHTPGPWSVGVYFSDSDDSWFYEHTISGPDGEFICHTSMTSVWGGNSLNAESNAHLIAAAPALLAACRFIVALYDAQLHAIAEPPEITQARAVVAEADGETVKP